MVHTWKHEQVKLARLTKKGNTTFADGKKFIVVIQIGGFFLMDCKII